MRVGSSGFCHFPSLGLGFLICAGRGDTGPSPGAAVSAEPGCLGSLSWLCGSPQIDAHPPPPQGDLATSFLLPPSQTALSQLHALLQSLGRKVFCVHLSAGPGLRLCFRHPSVHCISLIASLHGALEGSQLQQHQQ